MDDETLKKYYAIGWEVGLLDLVKDEVLRNNTYKFRLLSAANFVKIDSNRQYKIIDIGCGVGTTCFLIGKKHKNINFTCVDISEIQLQLSRKYAESIGMQNRFEFVVGDISKPLSCFERQYDYVICCEILEHLPFPGNLLENSKRCGNESTTYIFSFPLGKNRSNCIMYRVVDGNGSHFVTSDLSKAKRYIKYYEFYHKLYSFSEAIRLLNDFGFKVENIIGSNFLKGSTIGYYFHRITNYSLWLDRTINRFTNNILAENIVLSCKKRQE